MGVYESSIYIVMLLLLCARQTTNCYANALYRLYANAIFGDYLSANMPQLIDQTSTLDTKQILSEDENQICQLLKFNFVIGLICKMAQQECISLLICT